MSSEIPTPPPVPAPQQQQLGPRLKNWDRRRKIAALTIVPALLVASLIFSIPVAFILTNPLEIPIQLAVAVSVLAEILVILWAIGFAGLRPLKEKLLLGLKKWWYLLIGVGAGLLSYVILQVLALIANGITGEELDNSTTSNQLAGLTGVGGVLFLVVVVGILAPALEEFLFRGVLISALRNSTWSKAWISILISGVTFGIMHFQGLGSLTDVFILIWITIMGGFFAWLTIKTESLWTAVAAHVAYNSVTSVIIILELAG